MKGVGLFSRLGRLRHTYSGSVVASFPGLLTPAFVACSTNTASDKRWGEKVWDRG